MLCAKYTKYIKNTMFLLDFYDKYKKNIYIYIYIYRKNTFIFFNIFQRLKKYTDFGENIKKYDKNISEKLIFAQWKKTTDRPIMIANIWSVL